MYHRLEINEVFKSLGTSAAGLGGAEAEARLARYGRNELVEIEGFQAVKRFVAQFTDRMVLILIAAGIIAFLLGERIDAGVILGVVLLNAIIGFAQEFKAERSLEALKKLVEPMAIVVRDGRQQNVAAASLVPGDVILLEEGSRIPADCRLIEVADFRTQEAALTGESTPVEKSVEPVEASLPQAMCNMAFMGTLVVGGRAKAVVTATGMKTEFGRIADLTQNIEEEESPLQKELDRVGSFIGKATVAIALFIFMWGVMEGQELVMMFLFAVSLAVAAVPEGLPATVTIALALGVQRMARKNSVVRRLAAVETLGSTTVICSDKTGTLTRNEMTVREIYADDGLVGVSGVGYEPFGEFSSGGKRLDANALAGLRQLFTIAALCNNSSLVQKDGQWGIAGDPTEGALVVAVRKAGLTLDVLEREHPRIREIPFNAVRRRMTTIHRSGKQRVAFMKGAPVEVLGRCNRILVRGKEIRLSEKERSRLCRKSEELAAKALRVLAFAYKDVPDGAKGDVETGLTFAGLMGMLDPPREEVKGAVSLCRQAGINVIVITGDSGTTAKAIATEIGLHVDTVVDGEALERMDAAGLRKVLAGTPLFARASPAHKLRIVEALQQMGQIVAVTGDGINDAPALKRANIGVAMGITGTDVSKEAADMVLMDDSFATIVAAVNEGRTIYDDIQKFFRYIFSSNIGELSAVFLGMLLGLPLPLLAVQILWINLCTDMLPALALGVEPPSEDVMRRRPRRQDERMITASKFSMWLLAGLIIGAGTIAAYTLKLGEGVPKARTVAFCLMVAYQMVNVFNCRSDDKSLTKVGLFSNRYLVATVALSVALQLSAVYNPVMRALFHTVPLGLHDWVIIVGFSLTIFVFDELRKLFASRAHQ